MVNNLIYQLTQLLTSYEGEKAEGSQDSQGPVRVGVQSQAPGGGGGGVVHGSDQLHHHTC